MHTDEELEFWGDLFCNRRIHYCLRMDFSRFMALTDAVKRECIKALKPTQGVIQ